MSVSCKLDLWPTSKHYSNDDFLKRCLKIEFAPGFLRNSWTGMEDNHRA